MEERRKHPRVNLDGECIVRHSGFAGNIVNVSVGGIFCMCLDRGGAEEHGTSLDIFCTGNNFCVEGLQIEILSTELVRGKFSHSLGLRSCRAKFFQGSCLKIDKLYNIISAKHNLSR